MKRTQVYAALLLSLGTLIMFGNVFAQEETPTDVDKKAGYGSAVASPQPSDAKKDTAAPGSTKGSVDVKLTEFKIQMPHSVSPGATTFKVTNEGKETHGSEIEGNGIEKEIKPKLTSGKRGSLQVNLKPGAYKVYCPVDGHKMMGMSLELTVN